MTEIFRPRGEDLSQRPEQLEQKAQEHYEHPENVELQEFLPDDLREAIDQQQEAIEQLMEKDFGIPEIPKQLTAELEHILKVIEAGVREDRYKDEADNAVYEKLQHLAVKTAQYKDEPSDIFVKDVPEVGRVVEYETKSGERVERPMTVEEQDYLFNLELWADQMNTFKNIEGFQSILAEIKERAQRKPEAEQAGFIKTEMIRKYEKFGFTHEQIENLVVISGDEELQELSPEGEEGQMKKIAIMQAVWDQYLSAGEKTKYLKLAAGMAAAGMAEGVAPMLVGMTMDSPTAKAAAVFGMGYLSIQAASGWVKRKLSIEFDTLLNEVSEKDGGLNERLAKDLVFQPGEKMARREDRGRLLAAVARSQSAFRETLSAVAKTHVPATVGTATGLGMMMFHDWRLGLISLASAPIAMAVAKRTQRKLEPVIKETYRNESDVALAVEQQVNAHQDIVLSDMRDSMAERLKDLGAEKNVLTHKRVAARADLDFKMGHMLSPGVTAGIIAAGVALRETGVMEAGKIVTALVYSGLFRRNFDQIIWENNRLLESLGAIVEMEEVFNGYAKNEVLDDERRTGVSELDNFAIDVENVSLEIDGEKIIDDVSFQIPVGSVVRLEGRSGHGKTTMTRLLSGYYHSTGGEVRIGDHPVDQIKKTGDESLYRNMAYLSQQPYIFESGNLRENLEFGNLGVDDDSMVQVLDDLELTERFSKSGQLDLESSIRGLSGGESTRIGLARVLLKIRSQENGGIVFLDEVSSGLDKQTRAEVLQILIDEKRQRPDTTFIIISHEDEFMDALAEPTDGGEGFDIQSIKFDRGKIVEE